MNPASKIFLAVAAGSALFLCGCAHKPVRPTPNETVLGQQPGGAGSTALNPENGGSNPDLQARNSLGFDANNQLRGQVDSVYFDLDRSNIKASERPKVQAAKEYLDQHPDVRMLLEGHCDWRGTAEYNLALGDRRANEVKKYLVTLGVSADRLDTLSKGSEGATKEGGAAAWAKDRRVEFVVIPGSGGAGAPAAAPAAAPAGGDTGAAPAPAQ
jgi:peptidoglycan-associated lipoprotein